MSLFIASVLRPPKNLILNSLILLYLFFSLHISFPSRIPHSYTIHPKHAAHTNFEHKFIIKTSYYVLKTEMFSGVVTLHSRRIIYQESFLGTNHAFHIISPVIHHLYA